MCANFEVYILGAGGHGAVVADICVACGYSIAGIIDDNSSCHGTSLLNWLVLGGRDKVPVGALVAIGIGNNAFRGELLAYARYAGWKLPTLIHPSATISSFATVGEGTVVMPHVVVNARAQIGCGCILNTSSSIDHDCIIADIAHIAPGVRCAGNVTVGQKTLIGIGSSIHPGVTIGSQSVIGAGSVVIRDIPDNCIAYGNPAKVRG